MQKTTNIEQLNEFQMASLANQLNAIEPGSGEAFINPALDKGFMVMIDASLTVNPLMIAVPVALLLTALTLMILKKKQI